MTPEIITAPTVEPITLAEAKAQCRVDHNDEDALISIYISAAREQCEHLINRSIPLQTLEIYLDAFPSGDILLPRSPVVEVESVKYIDVNGTEQTLPTNQYYTENKGSPAWILRAQNSEFPQTSEVANAVTVRYVAGYAVVPSAIKQWIQLAVGAMYAHREHITESNNAKMQLPHDFFAGLLDRYRNYGDY